MLAVLAALPLSFVAAGEPWEDEPAFKTLVTEEVKVLKSLMQQAVKKDYRRQAWYFADRILQVDPTHAEAAAALDQWSAAELQLGQVPKPAFEKKRDGELRELGDQYFHFGELLDQSGMAPETYYPINVRAAAYGSRAGPLHAAFEQANFTWLGVYGPRERGEVEKLLGGDVALYTFPQEYDDAYLKAKAVWPAARGAMCGTWRLMTDHDYKEALRLLGMLAAAESWFVQAFGSNAKPKTQPTTNLLVFSEHQAYDKVGEDLLANVRNRDEFRGTSGWYSTRDDLLLVCWRHRHNPWLGDDDLMLGHAAGVMARMHLSAGQGSPPRGRGYWLLEGLRGAFEGFRVDADGKGEIDAAACWRLSAARALRDRDELIPWDEFMDVDGSAARARARPMLKVQFGGTEREAKEVDTVAAQATALVVGIMKAEGGKSLRKLAKLIGDVYKRDSLPDIDKALGFKKGKAVALANVAMDAAHGKKLR